LPCARIWVAVAAVADRGWQWPLSATAVTVSEATTKIGMKHNIPGSLKTNNSQQPALSG